MSRYPCCRQGMDGTDTAPARRWPRLCAARAGRSSGSGCGRRWRRLATAAGLFLTVSWLGLWLWLPPLGARGRRCSSSRSSRRRRHGPIRLLCACPAAADGAAPARSRQRRCCIVRRPTIADELAVTPSDPYSLALWHAHVARALAAARAFKAGWPSPRLVGARSLCAARPRAHRRASPPSLPPAASAGSASPAAFDWQGVVLPANFRVDAWVTPPPYTGKPPVILAGIHPGEMARIDSEPPTADRRAGRQHPGRARHRQARPRRRRQRRRDARSNAGGASPESAPRSTASTSPPPARRPCAALGDDLTWAFNAIPDKPPTIALAKDPEQQARGSLLLSYQLEDDYGVTEAHATFARKDEPASQGRRPASAVRAAGFRAGPAAGAHQERRRADHQGS